MLDFRVDLNKIFNGIKADSFTELPKIIEFKDIESKILTYIEGNDYYKIIADTNAYSLSPESLRLIGLENVKKIFKQFKEEIQKRCDIFYGVGRVKVVLFTDLIKNYKKVYKNLFKYYINEIDKLASKKELIDIGNYLKKHIGLKENIEEFTKKVICSYIVEGILIPLVLPNPIWINFDEPEVLAKFTNRIDNQVKILSKETLINPSYLDKISKEEKWTQ